MAQFASLEDKVKKNKQKGKDGYMGLLVHQEEAYLLSGFTFGQGNRAATKQSDKVYFINFLY